MEPRETLTRQAAKAASMELTQSLVERHAREYAETEPLADVEDEHAELLPAAFRSGEYGWRDAEWVVQWFYRRHLGAYPDADRRAAEAAYSENDFDEIRAAISSSIDAEDAVVRLDALTVLDGVDVPVASAFLHYTSPDRFVVVGRREWTALYEAGELPDPHPNTVSQTEYLQYQETCERLIDEIAVTRRDLQRALWRLGGN